MADSGPVSQGTGLPCWSWAWCFLVRISFSEKVWRIQTFNNELSVRRSPGNASSSSRWSTKSFVGVVAIAVVRTSAGATSHVEVICGSVSRSVETSSSQSARRRARKISCYFIEATHHYWFVGTDEYDFRFYPFASVVWNSMGRYGSSAWYEHGWDSSGSLLRKLPCISDKLERWYQQALYCVRCI
jgi:hypothetical protein